MPYILFRNYGKEIGTKFRFIYDFNPLVPTPYDEPTKYNSQYEIPNLNTYRFKEYK